MDEALETPGLALEPATRRWMEPLLGHDLSGVKVHTGDRAATSARALGSNAYTHGQEIVFAAHRFRPASLEGRRLIAHELVHVVQQRPAGPHPATTAPLLGDPGSAAEQEARTATPRLLSGQPVTVTRRASGIVQRDNGGGFALRPPRFQGYHLVPPMQLDPQIELRMEVIRRVQELLSAPSLRSTLRDRDLPGSAVTPDLATPPTAEDPLVPGGAGPETAREASLGDLLSALLAIPAVEAGLRSLGSLAEHELRGTWRALSTGQRALVVSHTVLLGAGALAGVLSHEGARRAALELIQDRELPVPGVPELRLRFQATGPDRRLMIHLDLGRLVSRLLAPETTTAQPETSGSD